MASTSTAAHSARAAPIRVPSTGGCSPTRARRCSRRRAGPRASDVGARRRTRDCESDAVYDLLVSNPKMADGFALFSTQHANLMTPAALDATSLATATAALAAQTAGGHALHLRARSPHRRRPRGTGAGPHPAGPDDGCGGSRHAAAPRGAADHGRLVVRAGQSGRGRHGDHGASDQRAGAGARRARWVERGFSGVSGPPRLRRRGRGLAWNGSKTPPGP